MASVPKRLSVIEQPTVATIVSGGCFGFNGGNRSPSAARTTPIL